MYVLQNNDMLFLSYFRFTISGDVIRHMLITIVNLSKIINYNQWFEKIIRFKICNCFSLIYILRIVLCDSTNCFCFWYEFFFSFIDFT